MEHIEVLLTLVEGSGTALSVEDVASAIRCKTDVAAARLAELEAAGLVASDIDARSYRYLPKTEPLRSAVGQLAELYHQRPVTLVRAVYERPVTPVASFNDLFRPPGQG
jgi:hypothetical protein